MYASLSFSIFLIQLSAAFVHNGRSLCCRWLTSELHAGPKSVGRRTSSRTQRSKISEISRERSRSNSKIDPVPFDGKALTAKQEPNEGSPKPLNLKASLDAGVLRCMSDDKDKLQHGALVSAPAFQFHSLKDLFGSAFSRIFHEDAEFRESLRTAMRKDIFDTTPAYQNLSEKAAAALLLPDSSLQGSWRKPADMDSNEERMRETTKLLESTEGVAFTGDELMHSIGALCGSTPSTHWIDIVGVLDRKIGHSFHQDTGLSPDESRTVLWGFPAENNYHGTGVFSHILSLEMECFAPSDHPRMEPVLYDGTVPPESIVRPEFAQGKEVLSYRDVDVLHSSPDVAYRTSVMRFM